VVIDRSAKAVVEPMDPVTNARSTSGAYDRRWRAVTPARSASPQGTASAGASLWPVVCVGTHRAQRRAPRQGV